MACIHWLTFTGIRTDHRSVWHRVWLSPLIHTQELLGKVCASASMNLHDAYRKSGKNKGGLGDHLLAAEAGNGGADTSKGGAITLEEIPMLQLMATATYVLNATWHFLAMLVFMTYNVGACIALMTGVGVGHYFVKTGPTQGDGAGVSVDCHSPRMAPAKSKRASFSEVDGSY